MLVSPGKQLEHLCQTAQHELTLVAPFVKFATLRQLMRSAGDSVAVNCITRWRPEEIAAGVSDTEIWHLFRDKPSCSLRLCYNLHAKFYRANSSCLVGSANLTATALGWSARPNIELLVPLDYDSTLERFEQDLVELSVDVDESIYRQFVIAAEKLQELRLPLDATARHESASEIFPEPQEIDLRCWLPVLRTPEKLFIAYEGKLDGLTQAARQGSLADLSVLDLPDGLKKDEFVSYLGTLLLQMPLVSKVDRYVEQPRRFGEVRAFLQHSSCSESMIDFDATNEWQTLMRWLLYFLPERYTLDVPRYSEVFQRRV